MPGRLMTSEGKLVGDVIASFGGNGLQCESEKITNICPWDGLEDFKFSVTMQQYIGTKILNLNQELTWTESITAEGAVENFWIKLIKNGESLALYNKSWGDFPDMNISAYPIDIFIQKVTLV